MKQEIKYWGGPLTVQEGGRSTEEEIDEEGQNYQDRLIKPQGIILYLPKMSGVTSLVKELQENNDC